MARASTIIQQVARWSGYIGGYMAMSVGLWHVVTIGAYIGIPTIQDGSDDVIYLRLTNDINKTNWRMRLFTLDPSFALDIWTPLLIGVISVMVHHETRIFDFLTENFSRFFFWNLFSVLFGTIGYNGLLGVICSIPAMISCVSSLVAAVFCQDSANLERSQFSKKPERKDNIARLEAQIAHEGVFHGWE